MPNLDKLALHLKIRALQKKKKKKKKDAKVEVVEADLNGEVVPNTHSTLKMQQVISKMIIDL